MKRDEDGIPILVDGVPIVERCQDISLPYRRKEVEAMLETLKLKT